MTTVTTTTERRSENPDPIDVHVGMRLRLRRNLIGMSQNELGKSVGLTFQQIQKYERGTNRMGASRLFQLAALLGVSVSWFFESLQQSDETVLRFQGGVSEEGQAPLEGAPSTGALPKNDSDLLQRRETMDLIRTYYRITDLKKRRKVLELIRMMADGDA